MWNLKSKRLLVLVLYMAVWCGVGMIAKEWDIFKYMVIPATSLIGGYILGESWKPSDGKPDTTQGE